jgi:hypothetical protein
MKENIMRKVTLEITLKGNRTLRFHADKVQSFTNGTYFDYNDGQKSGYVARSSDGFTYLFNGEHFDLFDVRAVIVNDK